MIDTNLIGMSTHIQFAWLSVAINRKLNIERDNSLGAHKLNVIKKNVNDKIWFGNLKKITSNTEYIICSRKHSINFTVLKKKSRKKEQNDSSNNMANATSLDSHSRFLDKKIGKKRMQSQLLLISESRQIPLKWNKCYIKKLWKENSQ